VAALRPSIEAMWGWDETLQRRIFTERFNPSNAQVIVIDGAIVGHLVVESHPREVFLARIALLPAWQGRGIGTHIVKGVVRRAEASGLSTRLHVLHTNERAQALYERLGFCVFGGDEHQRYLRIEPLS